MSAKGGVRLALGLTLLGVILSRLDLSELTVFPSRRLLAGVAAAVGLLLLSQAIAAVRWKLLLGPARELPWRYLFRLYLIGAFFSLFLPTAVGGDAVRALAAARVADRAGNAMASVVVDRMFGVLALLLYGALGVLLAPGFFSAVLLKLSWRPTAQVGMLAAGAVAVLLLAVPVVLRRSGRAQRMLREGLDAVRIVSRSPDLVATATLLALVVQGCVIALWIVLARSVSFALPTESFLITVPLVSLGSMLPVTIAGLGVREGIWLILLGNSGLAPANIVAFSLLYFTCNVVVGFVGAATFMKWGTGRRSGTPAGNQLRGWIATAGSAHAANDSKSQ